jgi:carbonic anhydrase/acetyltransferase-like protein (isoleucine patch superfamily)
LINDTNKPLVFVGSNLNIYKVYELVESLGITIAGIIDNDYHGQGEYKGIPVIGSEEDIADLKDQYQFLCVTNWIPGTDPVIVRNNKKRHRIINLLDSLGVDQATIISNLAQVSKRATIGKGVIIDAFAMIEPNIIINDHTTVYAYSVIGHDSVIGKNVVIQRYCLITSTVNIQDNVYIGLCSRVSRSKVTVSEGTFVHPNLTLLRGTIVNEEISLAGQDLRKVYQQIEVE